MRIAQAQKRGEEQSWLPEYRLTKLFTFQILLVILVCVAKLYGLKRIIDILIWKSIPKGYLNVLNLLFLSSLKNELRPCISVKRYLDKLLTSKRAFFSLAIIVIESYHDSSKKWWNRLWKKMSLSSFAIETYQNTSIGSRKPKLDATICGV